MGTDQAGGVFAGPAARHRPGAAAVLRRRRHPGRGIYALIGSVAARIGGALWLPFLLAFVVAFLTALSYLELVGKYPRAAGAALYTQLAFGVRFLTFMVAFAVMASGVTSAASAATAFGETYLAPVRRPCRSGSSGCCSCSPWAWSTSAASANRCGPTSSSPAVELSGLLIVIAIGVWAVAHGSGEPGKADRDIGGRQRGLDGHRRITAATSLAFFAMVGFEDAVNMAEETTDPQRPSPGRCCWGWSSPP